jgi:hypothetical protein
MPDKMVKLNREQGTDFLLPKWAFSKRQETSVSCSYAEKSPFYLENNMKTKQCSKCKEIKPIEDFYKCGDKRHSWCKWCLNRRDRRKYNNGWRKDNDYYSRPEIRERRRIRAYVWRGLISKEDCFVCSQPAEAHHPNYGDPFKVIWLCRKHHREHHQNLHAISQTKNEIIKVKEE